MLMLETRPPLNERLHRISRTDHDDGEDGIVAPAVKLFNGAAWQSSGAKTIMSSTFVHTADATNMTSSGYIITSYDNGGGFTSQNRLGIINNKCAIRK